MEQRWLYLIRQKYWEKGSWVWPEDLTVYMETINGMQYIQSSHTPDHENDWNFGGELE
jgi:hypothetical protein